MARVKECKIWKRDGLIMRQYHHGVAVKSIAKHWDLSESAVYAVLKRRSRCKA